MLLPSAFGLLWSSPDLPLPELPTGESEVVSHGLEATTVSVAREQSSSWPPAPRGPHDTPFLRMAPGDLRLQVEGIARFRVSGGHHIAFEPWQGDGDEQDLRTFLLGSAVGALLIQRGMLEIGRAHV